MYSRTLLLWTPLGRLLIKEVSSFQGLREASWPPTCIGVSIFQIRGGPLYIYSKYRTLSSLSTAEQIGLNLSAGTPQAANRPSKILL